MPQLLQYPHELTEDSERSLTAQAARCLWREHRYRPSQDFGFLRRQVGHELTVSNSCSYGQRWRPLRVVAPMDEDQEGRALEGEDRTVLPPERIMRAAMRRRLAQLVAEGAELAVE